MTVHYLITLIILINSLLSPASQNVLPLNNSMVTGDTPIYCYVDSPNQYTIILKSHKKLFVRGMIKYKKNKVIFIPLKPLEPDRYTAILKKVVKSLTGTDRLQTVKSWKFEVSLKENLTKLQPISKKEKIFKPKPKIKGIKKQEKVKNVNMTQDLVSHKTKTKTSIDRIISLIGKLPLNSSESEAKTSIKKLSTSADLQNEKLEAKYNLEEKTNYSSDEIIGKIETLLAENKYMENKLKNTDLLKKESPLDTKTKRAEIAEPSDILNISVWNHPDLSLKVEVDKDGTITFPLIGEVFVQSLSKKLIAKLISKKLSEGYIKNPFVMVKILKRGLEEQIVKISVIGDVKRPGLLSFEYKPTLLEVYAKTGGKITSQDKDIYAQVLTSSGIKNIKFSEILAGDLSANLRLNSGDTVIFKVKTSSDIVYVLGNVLKPGAYRWYKNMRILDLLLTAGGPSFLKADYRSPQDHFRAKLEKCIVIRKVKNHPCKILTINVNRIINKGDLTQNIKLKKGDVFVVPEERVKNIYTFMSRIKPVLDTIIAGDKVVKIFE